MNAVFVTGNPEKAANFARHIGMDISHQAAELDEIQTLDAAELVTHKVKQAFQQIGRPVLVEDVTFVFEAWGDLPGPFVKFFIDMPDGLAKMCRMLDSFDSRRAYAACTFGYFDGARVQLFQGNLAGTVADKPRGTNGYGFDPIFQPDGFDGKTAGELNETEYERYYTAIKPFSTVRTFLEQTKH